MPSSETIEIRNLKSVVGEKEDLPSLNTRASLISRVRALVTKFFGVPQLIHLYGALGLNKTLTLGSNSSEGIVSLFSDGTYLYASVQKNQGSLVKIDLNTFTVISTITLNSDEYILSIVSDGSYLYLGLQTLEAGTGRIIKVELSTFTIADSVSTDVISIYSLVSDGTYLYGATYGSQSIIKISLDTLTVIDSFAMGSNVVALFSDGNYLYAGSNTEGKIVKIELNTFTLYDTLILVSESNINALFSDGNYLYAGTYTNPGEVLKIDLNTFTLVDKIVFTLAQTEVASMFADLTYLYVGLSASIGTLVIIDLSTFTIINTINTGAAFDSIWSLYSDGTYLYFGKDNILFRKYIIPSSDQYQRKIDITKDSVQSAISATTSAGNVGGTTLVDTARTEGNDYWNNMSVLLLGGVCKGQVRRISDFDAATDTITVSPAFTSQIAASTKYEIIPTGSGTSTLTQADILSDATPFAGADIAIIKTDTQTIEDSTLKASPTAGSLATYIASGGTSLGTALPASKSLYDVIALDRLDNATYGLSAIETLVDELESRLTATRAGYLDFLATTDNNFSTITANWQTAEATVFQIAQDTRYEITGASVDLTGCTAASVWTFRFYRAYAAAGASYRIAGDTITRIVGTDNPVIELQNWIHYGYTKITAQSNTAGDNGKIIVFTWIKRTLE